MLYQPVEALGFVSLLAGSACSHAYLCHLWLRGCYDLAFSKAELAFVRLPSLSFMRLRLSNDTFFEHPW